MDHRTFQHRALAAALVVSVLINVAIIPELFSRRGAVAEVEESEASPYTADTSNILRRERDEARAALDAAAVSGRRALFAEQAARERAESKAYHGSVDRVNAELRENDRLQAELIGKLQRASVP